MHPDEEGTERESDMCPCVCICVQYLMQDIVLEGLTGRGGRMLECMISGRMRKHYKVFHVDLASFMC